MICTPETNFCRVFELPDKFSNEFLFSGPIEVTFKMVNWFNPVPDNMQNNSWENVKTMLIDFIKNHKYVIPGHVYLVITDFGESFTLSK